ncbi:sensor histidine kinase [Nonomuraea sp. NPDC050556]|uniref:sensor histidine kinase n=1 Tax=Nonomuraea sp. NPDC050556 TaxID=3364369 RepID=UPI00378F5205
MHLTPSLPMLKRVPPGAWTTLAWYAGLAFTFLIRLRLPGESEPAMRTGALLYRWDGLAYQVVATALVLLGSVLLRHRPLQAMALLLGAAVLATMPLGVSEIPLAQFLAVDVALYFVAAARPRRTGLIAAAMALAVLAAYLTTRLLYGWHVGTSAELTAAMTVAIAWLAGHLTHQTHQHAERLRAQATNQAVTDERLRIARELHDMVAHSIGIIALQAGAARQVIASQPGRADDALAKIEIAGRETLSGLRRMLGALRQPEPGQPAPDHMHGLADVEGLVARTAEAGIRVDLRWVGEQRPLPPDLDVSAYRIIQEALTNVVRHAGAAACQVSIEYRDEELSIEILDGGKGRSHAGEGGYGLVGMRERVSLLHGTLSAQTRPEGGFRVAACLPVPAGVR